MAPALDRGVDLVLVFLGATFGWLNHLNSLCYLALGLIRSSRESCLCCSLFAVESLVLSEDFVSIHALLQGQCCCPSVPL